MGAGAAKRPRTRLRLRAARAAGRRPCGPPCLDGGFAPPRQARSCACGRNVWTGGAHQTPVFSLLGSDYKNSMSFHTRTGRAGGARVCPRVLCACARSLAFVFAAAPPPWRIAVAALARGRALRRCRPGRSRPRGGTRGRGLRGAALAPSRSPRSLRSPASVAAPLSGP